jgi:GTP cyclohydrolase IA
MSVDRAAAADAIAAFLRALGHDPSLDGQLLDTPAKVVAAFADELLSGEGVDLENLLRSGSMAIDGAAPPGSVVVRDLAVVTVCPHHLTLALGRATVSYLPGTRLLGLGTLARLVDACARRLTLQERIGQQVVEALVQHAGARGAMCRLTLRHGCLCARGACQPDACVETLATAGELYSPDLLR